MNAVSLLRYSIIFCLATFGCSSASFGQVLTWQPGQTGFPVGLKPDGTPGAKTDEGPKTILLHPMPEPSPALKYRFWVTAALRDSGSVMPHITRAQLFYFDRPNLSQLRKEYADRSEAWHDSPLDQMPKEEVRKYLTAFQKTLDELHKAANLERIEYDLSLQDLRGVDVFDFLLIEVQNYRELGRLLRLEARLAIAEHRFDDAVRSLQTGFRLSEVVSASGGSLLIGKLVSIAITGMMLGCVEEMIQLPDAPNMYWALASIPDSLWEMREAIEGESTNIRRLLGAVMEDSEPGDSASTWNARVVRGIVTIGSLGSRVTESTDERSARLVAGLLLAASGDRSRIQLARLGIDAATVATMPSAQAVILAFRINIETVQSEFFKNVLLPSKIRDIHITRAEKQYTQRVKAEFADPATITTGLLLPAIKAAFSASLRTEAVRNRLATLEAIRAYSSVHGDKLPVSLDDLIPVPAFENPFTQKQFEYRRISDTEAVFHISPQYPGDTKTELKLRLILR